MPLAHQTLLILFVVKTHKRSEATFNILFLSVAFDCQYDDKIEFSLALTVYQTFEYTRQGSAPNSHPCHID